MHRPYNDHDSHLSLYASAAENHINWTEVRDSVRNRHPLRLLLQRRWKGRAPTNPETSAFLRLHRPGHEIGDPISLLTGATLSTTTALIPCSGGASCSAPAGRGGSAAPPRRGHADGILMAQACSSHNDSSLLGGVRCGDEQHGDGDSLSLFQQAYGRQFWVDAGGTYGRRKDISKVGVFSKVAAVPKILRLQPEIQCCRL
ncbi:hypothetical protein B0H13DRAFT_2297886 [Mycena leptocephala]|nr:hypothetical protein B0H13DRAFT_2297886 [Mycena leptocephala]